MNLASVKLSFLRQNNKEGLNIIQKIQSYVKQHNVSYNKAITYYLSNCQTKFQKKILNICRTIYPYDGELNLNQVINIQDINNTNLKENIEQTTLSTEEKPEISYVTKFSNFKQRIKHNEDTEIKDKNIGIGKVVETPLYMEQKNDTKVPVETINVSEIKKKKKTGRKKKTIVQ